MSANVRPMLPNDPAADATAAQHRAADPARSVWVGASAGSGKTTVLTNRLLRLMLPQEDGTPATAPERILCLTYTRAAAREMALRLHKRLSAWAAMTPVMLARNLEETLLGRAPTDTEITAARQLFARVIDAAGGLKIMTIHSFCASVLGRFPLEAGVPPSFTALEPEEAAALLARARDDVLATARQMDGPLARALASLSIEAGADGFDGLLAAIMRECRQLRGVQKRFGDGEALYRALADAVGVDTHDTDEILQRAVHDDAFAAADLRAACRILLEHGNDNSDRKAAEALDRWLAAAMPVRAVEFPVYAQIFLTQAGEIRKKLATVAILRRWPAIGEHLQMEAERVFELQDALKGAACACLTGDLVVLGGAIYERYQALKHARAALDFDDLINKTLDLLTRENIASWVMYKLDGGLDHILIDEAQDTNPEQWDIVRALSADFFAGHTARDAAHRTIFAVGDEKQSIYSFQRAAPEKFRAMREYFSVQVRTARKPWWTEPLNVSFRSSPSILQFVDEAFEPDAMRQGLSLEKLEHRSNRPGDAGLVELWPLFGTPEKANHESWLPPVTPVDSRNGGARLADHIAHTIRGWLDQGEMLVSRGRLIAPGDILILVRNRNAFVNQLIRSLKAKNIPVTGLDRMVLREQLAVQDLLAAAQFALLPEDDLTLATLLKSPLLGWDEEQLASAALSRTATLWRAVQETAPAATTDYLRELIHRAGMEHPYAFFSRLLQSPCPADTISGLHAISARLGHESFDPLDEFLNEALHFGRRQIGTLQGFICAIASDNKTIKREQEEAGQAVRIMTVHGAKGLEAPIVFLPDTVRTGRNAPNKKAERLLWPDKTGAPVPLWSPRQALDCRRYGALLQRQEALQDEEYRRLFYVALTRAQDRLYIAGHVGAKDMMPESWYEYARDAFTRLPAETENFISPFFLKVENEDKQAETTPQLYRLANPQTRIVKMEMAAAAMPPSDTNNGWHFTGVPVEPAPARPLTPSRPALNEPAVFSPLASAPADRFRRGTVTHQLLQYLPALPAATRMAAAENFVAQQAADLPSAMAASIVAETLAILQNPAWVALFGPDSLAEVPVTGMVGNRLISGQIDRLLVTREELWIVDYKTNRPAPSTVDAIPGAYRQQLQAYSDIVAKIYPVRNVRGFLLWTDGPKLMEISLQSNA